MDRIFDKPITSEAREKWLNLVPKVFQIAQLEQNSKTIEFLGGTETYSEGKSVRQCMAFLSVCMSGHVCVCVCVLSYKMG